MPDKKNKICSYPYFPLHSGRVKRSKQIRRGSNMRALKIAFLGLIIGFFFALPPVQAGMKGVPAPLADGAPLKFSPSHWLKNIPAPPPNVSVAEDVCPDIRAMPARIEAARIEAEKSAGDEKGMEQLAQELMMRGNITLLQEMARMEQERHLSGGGPQPLKRQQAMTELDELRRELRTALGQVNEGLPECHIDEKRGIEDTACIEKNYRTVSERIDKAYNNYLHLIQSPLLKLRKETERLIAMEESINRVESGSDSPEVHRYMLQIRVGLLDVVRDYARERSNTCVYFDRQKKRDSND
ncbi:MAG: hypothetical protein ACNA7H_08500 [Desulfotignum sp.]